MRFCRKEKERSVIKLLTNGNGRFFVPSYTCPYAFIQHEYPRHRRQGRGLHRAAAIGSLLVLGQSAYAETKAAAAEEGVQEMPERVMTIRSRSLRAETVSSATLTNMKTEEVPQTVNVITRDLMDSKGSDSLVEALRMDSSVNTGGDMLLSRTADQYTIRGFAGSDVQIGNMPSREAWGMAWIRP